MQPHEVVIAQEEGKWKVYNTDEKLRWRKRDLELRKEIREMKNNQSFFWCSLCHNGLLGGELIVDKSTITYKTGKVTVSEKYRNLELRRSCIVDLSWRWIVFPIVTFEMNNMEKYSFLIFNKRRFMKVLNNN